MLLLDLHSLFRVPEFCDIKARDLFLLLECLSVKVIQCKVTHRAHTKTLPEHLRPCEEIIC